MPVEHVHSYLVHPGKGDGSPTAISGATVPKNGKLFELLSSIYDNSNRDCDIEILFRHNDDGTKQNDCRDLIISYLAKPSLPQGRTLALRMQSMTDKRSGIGLCFIISGTEGKKSKLVLSRFPTDSAILADETSGTLTVEFLERVFMKSATSYKAAAYEHASLKAGFWFGRAVDKQLSSRLTDVSNYWIFDFLASDFRVTSAAGTRQLGAALRNAAKISSDLLIRSEIAAAVTLAANMDKKQTSVSEFLNGLHLSPAAIEAVVSQLPDSDLATVKFFFDREEFKAQVAYRSIELNNGALLTADSANFDEVFKREALSGSDGQVRYTTKGKVVNERLGKSQVAK